MSRKGPKQYWKGIEERDRTAAFEKSLGREFPESLTVEPVMDTGISRRSFLKATGFSMAGSLLASCAREPVEKAIPLLVQDEHMTPGKAYWYASTCGGCQAGCGILTKNRDGRPIKVEGNPQHPVSEGGLCAVGQAAVLGLYDSMRLRNPEVDGVASDWASVDAAVRRQLAPIQDGVYLLTGAMTSPTTQAVIRQFLAQFREARHVVYDPVSYSAILDAHERTHGARLLPHYRFDQAEVIVSVDADFLGAWLSPVEFTRAYVRGRTLDGDLPKLSRHVQLEGRMSVTGTNADRRITLTPDEYGTVLRMIAERLAQRAGMTIPQLETMTGATQVGAEVLDDMAERLWAARGRSLVVCGLNDTGVQCVVNAVNHILGNYGATIDITQPSLQWQSDDRAVEDLLEAMHDGRVNALIMADVNPAYSLPDAAAFMDAARKVPLTVTIASHKNETTAVSRYVCPALHALESWNDAEIVAGLVSVSQPAIATVGQNRSLRACLTAWMGFPQNDHALMQAHWQEHLYPRREQDRPFQLFWDQAVHDGFARLKPQAPPVTAYRNEALWPGPVSAPLSEGRFAMVLYEKVSMRDGRNAHNAWLHELPDPVSKAVWENYLCMAPAAATGLGLQEGDIVRISGEGRSIDLPVQIQPGQHERVVAVAVGYGHAGTDRFSKVGPQWISGKLTVEEGGTIGRNSFGFATWHNHMIVPVSTVSLSATGQRTELALTQTHHTITEPEHLGGHRRDLVRETTLAAYQKDPSSGNHATHEYLELWADDYPYTGHHWGLAIDLNRCTGCSACVISCQAENNVPAVGKDEVYRRREMHWIRIDRYYSGEGDDVEVLYQPVMCQHCDHAPCEAVCPVLATVHSEEGLNQQIYNRCVGTRYCANNCPYKVRRFNWFDYWRTDARENLALNPDITTRTRGVMEKCSMCVQRIQEARAETKRRGATLADGDIQVACQQSCPAQAIVFGDMNDPESRLSRLINHPRHYRMLEENNYRPTVGYLVKVRNRAAE